MSLVYARRIEANKARKEPLSHFCKVACGWQVFIVKRMTKRPGPQQQERWEDVIAWERRHGFRLAIAFVSGAARRG
ncbi:MAG: hypothetical protein AcusKO_23660 [Acuticoccus sp.]